MGGNVDSGLAEGLWKDQGESGLASGEAGIRDLGPVVSRMGLGVSWELGTWLERDPGLSLEGSGHVIIGGVVGSLQDLEEGFWKVGGGFD